MANMGSYCKAYLVNKLRAFPGWVENQAGLRQEEAASEEPRTLKDDDFLYVQENFMVTDGIFIDENIVFDNVTPEWKEFCVSTLGFRLPDCKLAKVDGSGVEAGVQTS